MTAMRIIPAFNEFKDRHARFNLSFEVTANRAIRIRRVVKKLSLMGLSKQSPTEPIEGRAPAASQHSPKASEVYWVDSNGRRNITF